MTISAEQCPLPPQAFWESAKKLSRRSNVTPATTAALERGLRKFLSEDD